MNTSPRSRPLGSALPGGRRALTAGLAALGLLAGACTSDGDSAGSVDLDGDDVVLTSASLSTAGSCDELLDLLIAEGVERVGPYGFGQGGYWGIEEDAMAMEESGDFDAVDGAIADDSATAEGSATGGDGGFSGTNNQEVGVDEPDIVKTDGERLVVSNGNTLRVIDVATDELIRTIDLGDDTWVERFFLSGDSAIVMTTTWSEVPLAASTSDAISLPHGLNVARLTEVDLDTGETLGSVEFEGWILSARDTDGTIRVAVSTDLSQRFPFLYPSNEGAEEAAEEANKDLLRDSTIEQWLPTYRLLDGDGDVVDDGLAVPCDAFHLPQEFSGLGAVTVVTLDAGDDGLEITDRLAVLSNGQTVYASTDRLTIATQSYPVFDWRTGEVVDGEEDEVSVKLHNFDTTVAGATDYVASGAVTGHLLSQYSLSEYDGYLRVATTEGSQWWGNDEDSESFVTVLDEVDGALVEVGQVGGLGKGERIFAVRFMGDVGYVVTFRQVDPLYTVDLSEPTAPTVLGELKIPGFSTYLHPVGDGLLMGVGQDATDDGRTTGAQVSSFDVSDLTNPLRVDQRMLGSQLPEGAEGQSYSTVDWDPLAFTWWAPTRTAFVPVSWWGWDEQTGTDHSGADVVAVQVADDGTLSELGRLEQAASEQCETWYEEEWLEEDVEALEAEEAEAAEGAPGPDDDSDDTGDAEAGFAGTTETAPPADEEPVAATTAPVEEYCWTWQPEIRRTVIVGDAVYTISERGVGVHDLEGFADRDFISFE